MPACELVTPAKPEPRCTEGAQRLVVTWQHPVKRSIEPIGFLSYDGHAFGFSYIRNAREVEGFKPLLGFEDLRTCYKSEELFPLFAERVMSPRRPDYQDYVSRLGLEGDSDPWEQITRSSGQREGDALQFLPEPTVTGGRLAGLFLVHGVRHVAEEVHVLDGRAVHVTDETLEGALGKLKVGDELGLAQEPGNPKNPMAVMVIAPSLVPVGWVPNLLLEDLDRLQTQAQVDVRVVHVNGPDAPSHLRLLARFTAPVADFRFFTGPGWEPLGTVKGQ
jgi:hypothetical protein